MKIRKMKPSDFEQIVQLWKEINVSPEAIADDKKNFPLMLKLNPSTCFIAIENKKIVGSIFGLFNGRRAFIYHLGVHPDMQKKKLGSELLLSTEKALKKAGTNRILLWVDFDNLKITNFYNKHGYTVCSDAVLFGKNV